MSYEGIDKADEVMFGEILILVFPKITHFTLEIASLGKLKIGPYFHESMVKRVGGR